MIFSLYPPGCLEGIFTTLSSTFERIPKRIGGGIMLYVWKGKTALLTEECLADGPDEDAGDENIFILHGIIFRKVRNMGNGLTYCRILERAENDPKAKFCPNCGGFLLKQYSSKGCANPSYWCMFCGSYVNSLSGSESNEI
jgi:hypothetical protein